jgi:outer membrane lipoprotein-sorting protein
MKIVHLSLLLLLCLYSSLLSAYSFGQNKVQATKEEWSKIETMHFDVYFPKGEDEFGKTAIPATTACILQKNSRLRMRCSLFWSLLLR